MINEDLIYRSAAIDAFIEKYSYIDPMSIIQTISDLPSAQQWIPCSERLPEVEGLYLVTVKNDHKRIYSKTAWYSKTGWFARQDVTHWMPLPEPCKGEQDERD